MEQLEGGSNTKKTMDETIDAVFKWLLTEDRDVILAELDKHEPTEFGLAIAEAVYPEYRIEELTSETEITITEE